MDTTEELRTARGHVTLRDHQRLRDALADVDHEGWSGKTATALLSFVRVDLVRPLVVDLGLRGAAASQAEATGWGVAWEVLREPGLRSAVSPWGVVWTAVRRAVLGEIVAARYCTSARKAWRICSGESPVGFAPQLVEIDGLSTGSIDSAWGAEPTGAEFGVVLGPILGALVQEGWEPAVVAGLVERIAATAEPGATQKVAKAGWRPIAEELGIEAWRVRRLMVALLGEPGWPGLIERVMDGGCAVLNDAGAKAAAMSTLTQWMRPPRGAARTAEARSDRRRTPQAA
ncbi:hypothetical protein GALL_330330 [mine drainage metagenome]|uniref:Uncharacterized protein n=1 Tax=mine drainage metagenome TaxID=410659 RepID=A0A1J5R5Z9_9ZZZZ